MLGAGSRDVDFGDRLRQQRKQGFFCFRRTKRGGKESSAVTADSGDEESPASMAEDGDSEPSGESTAFVSEGPVSLADAKRPSDGDFIYDKFDNYVELTGYQGKDEVIILPSTIEGLPVELYGFVISEKSHVRGIVIDEGYESIPNIGCESNESSPIESIRIPSTCTEGTTENPFWGLPYLSTVEVEDGNPVYSVEDGILYSIYGGEYKILVWYPPTREDEVFYQPDGTLLGGGCFDGTQMLKRVENAHSWSGANAFEGSSIEEIVCSDQWTFLGQHEFEDFSGESKLRSITLSVNLNDLVWKVEHFKGLDNLEEIIVPEGNTTFFSEDGVLYYDNGKDTYLLKYPNAHPGEDFTISEKATVIYYTSTVFENPKYLKRIHGSSYWEGMSTYDLPEGIELIIE